MFSQFRRKNNSTYGGNALRHASTLITSETFNGKKLPNKYGELTDHIKDTGKYFKRAYQSWKVGRQVLPGPVGAAVAHAAGLNRQRSVIRLSEDPWTFFRHGKRCCMLRCKKHPLRSRQKDGQVATQVEDLQRRLSRHHMHRCWVTRLIGKWHAVAVGHPGWPGN